MEDEYLVRLTVAVYIFFLSPRVGAQEEMEIIIFNF